VPENRKASTCPMGTQFEKKPVTAKLVLEEDALDQSDIQDVLVVEQEEAATQDVAFLEEVAGDIIQGRHQEEVIVKEEGISHQHDELEYSDSSAEAPEETEDGRR
jgi:hypothetical protein